MSNENQRMRTGWMRTNIFKRRSFFPKTEEIFKSILIQPVLIRLYLLTTSINNAKLQQQSPIAPLPLQAFLAFRWERRRPLRRRRLCNFDAFSVPVSYPLTITLLFLSSHFYFTSYIPLLLFSFHFPLFFSRPIVDFPFPSRVGHLYQLFAIHSQF